MRGKKKKLISDPDSEPIMHLGLADFWGWVGGEERGGDGKGGGGRKRGASLVERETLVVSEMFI